MNKTGADSAVRSGESPQWTLIRRARQLLTLRGASGPRRGSAMSDLNVISDGALLVRDGVVEEVGTTRRVENLVPAHLASVIDCAGKVVMPAFIDPDIALAAPAPCDWTGGASEESDIRRMSQRRLEGNAAAMAADLARYGILTVGAHTLFAPDLQNTNKALRLHLSMQSKPLRIRSVFSPPCVRGKENGSQRARIGEVWMPAIFRKKLCSLLELPVTAATTGDAWDLAAAAATAGFNIRFRVSGPTTTDVLELAYSAGAVALIGQVPENGPAARSLADVGCVNVVLGTRVLAGNFTSKRSAIDDGMPVAIASGYRSEGTSSINPQFLLYLACHALDMTVEEAIVAATYNAACSLRFSHVTGSLAPGKSADICVMDVDDYHELVRRAGHHDLSLAMRAGKIVYRGTSQSLD